MSPEPSAPHILLSSKTGQTSSTRKIDTASVDYFQEFWVERGYQKRVLPDKDYLLDWTGLDVEPRT